MEDRRLLVILSVVVTLTLCWPLIEPSQAFSNSQGGEVIVQLFEWRWEDIAEECRTFLPQHGYTAVQTSPANENAVMGGRPWYERYQPFSYRLVTRSGDEEAFRSMVQVCNQNNIKVFVDVIVNHMSANLPDSTIGTAGSRPNTLTKHFPDVPYGPGDFHETCPIKNWDDPWQVRNCELVGLHDLKQSSDYVRGKIAEFLNKLIAIGVAGFRVDAAKHVKVEELSDIFSRVRDLNTKYFPANTRPYIYQEIGGDPVKGAILPRDYFTIGSAMDFKFGLALTKAFRRGDPLKWFRNFGTSWGLLPWNHSVVFIDNHDTQRDGSLSYKESKLYKMAVGFMLSWPHSVARVMSSFAFETKEQGPPADQGGQISRVIRHPDLTCSNGWICEHRWRQIYNMVIFRNTVLGSLVSDWWDNDGYQIAFCRKGKGFVAFNVESYPLTANLQTCLPSGVYCDVISGSKTNENSCTGKTVTVGAGGRADISLPHDQEDGILAIHIGCKIA